MDNYCIYGKLTVQEGKREELLGYMQQVVAEMERVEDCFCYILGTKPDDSDSIYIYEVWKNQEAHHASLSLTVFRDLIAKARPIISGMENMDSLTIVGGKAKL